MSDSKSEEREREGWVKQGVGRSFSSESYRANSNGTKHPQIFDQKPQLVRF